MKKLSALLTALTLSMTAMPFTAYANPDEGYLPVMYLSVEDNDKISVLPDGTVYINNKNLTGDDSIRVNIYVQDESKSCWNIAPKVKCADGNIKFNENAEENETTAYGSQHEFISSVNKEYNTVNITFKTPLLETGTKLEVTGENTDDYPIAYFNADVNSEIPAGAYRIYFLTEPEDDPDQRLTQISFRYDDGESGTFTPEVRDQKIVVSDRALGDINDDGIIDAVDASAILTEYALVSTKGEGEFSVEQKYSANINVDDFVDANDATAIQCYYAYLSTNQDPDNKLDFVTYLATEFIE
ncbi:MAG: hypothetical protein K2K89_03920 [Ruminococcus sp.]|nr:hypothetical protein [Ruminococcus sp.]